MSEKMRQLRAVATEFQTREDGETPHIMGYFAVFNSVYEIGPGMSESIAPGAFSDTLAGDDIRVLINHDSTLVAGRTKAETAELHEDSIGLWGDVAVNPNDSDAMNAYYRVKRRDVDQASFGFDIVEQDTEVREDGSVHWTIRKVKLYEVSICTFPAYEATSLNARAAERDDINAKRLEAWKIRMKGVLEHGTEGAAAEKAD